MIDFKNAEYLKLKVVPNETFVPMIAPMFVDGEHAIQAFQTIRDGIVFTNKRIFAINVQGIIQAFSVETAGVLDLDSELELWFSGLGKVKFEFTSNADISSICKTISTFVLQNNIKEKSQQITLLGLLHCVTHKVGLFKYSS